MSQTCKTCASTRFKAVQGKLVCQLCGAPYSETGDFLVDTKAAMPILCERGYQKLQTGEYSLAELIFNRMLEIDSNSFMAGFGRTLALLYMYSSSKDQEKKKELWDSWRKIRTRFSSTTPEERNLVKEYCEPLRLDSWLSEKGSNLLIYGILLDMSDLVKFLLDCGFDPNFQVDYGRGYFSALYVAARRKKYAPVHGEIVSILLKYGASPYCLASDGDGVINSVTPPEIAQIIRKQYPDVKCIDRRPTKPAKTSSPTRAKPPTHNVTRPSKPAPRPMPSNNAEYKKGCSCLLVIAILILAGCIGGINSCVNSRSQAITTTSSKEHEHVKCRSYVWVTKWNHGYCSTCHKGTHKCAHEGCEVQIPDSAYQAYCIYHQ